MKVNGNYKMIRILAFILVSILLANGSFGQTFDRKFELEKIFLQLPIDTNLTFLIDAAKSDTSIKKNNDTFSNKSDYFIGYLSSHRQFIIQPKSYQIEIFTSKKYGTGGQIVDTILTIALYATYGNTLTKEIKKQYKELVATFKNLSSRSEEFTLHSDPGKSGKGYNFYGIYSDKIPYLTISLKYGDCLGENYSILICYNRTGNWN